MPSGSDVPPTTEGGIFKSYDEMTPGQQAAWRLGYAAMEKRHLAWLQRFVDAEKSDRKYGLDLPGDAALSALLCSADEVLGRA